MSEGHIKQGLQAYKEHMDDRHSTPEQIIHQHSLLVKRIALHLLSRLPKSVQLEDLLQAGMIGLLEASQRFDPNSNASFETYAGIRIRGAMIDELRRNHWAPRSAHQSIRKVSEAIQTIEKRNHKSANASEIAAELNISIDDYYSVLDHISANEWVSIDDVTEDQFVQEDDDNPEKKVAHHDLVNFITAQLPSLPEREQLILSLYYNEEFNFKEIAKILELTEARVSQLHSQAIARLNAKIKRN